MKKVNKRIEPAALSEWKARNPGALYRDLPDELRIQVRERCAAEQYFICAYCCAPISGTRVDTMNEHVKSRRHHPALQLDYQNIVASCTIANQCDDAHGSNDFELTPFMEACETELVYLVSGAIRGKTERANETINALNLGRNLQENKRLVESRRVSIMGFISTQGLELQEIAEDIELKELILGELDESADGRLMPYAPVIASVIRAFT